ncbi:MAG: transglutaminase N-terminal domain-containing protein, partial [Cyanobacteriota bacterium]|nr:transglutaminase N-terminal domain-containing protein [Cyanobacteriota bacterium]
MSVKVSLNHRTNYQYNRPILLGPQTIRLRPAPHCRTPIQSYSLQIHPQNHTITWHQDLYGNFLARINFPQPTDIFKIEVNLIADLQPFNPFDFLIENYAERYPFNYEPQLHKELSPLLEIVESGDILNSWIETNKQENIYTTQFLTTVNQKLSQDINYNIRLEPGIQTCEETLLK